MTQPPGAIPAHLDGPGHTEDRRSVRLDTAWLIHGQAATPRSSRTLTRDTHTPVLVSPQSPALAIVSDAIPAIADAAATAIRAGQRVYAVAPAGWADSGLPDWLATAPATSVLVRRARDVPIAGVLNGNQGWLWCGPTGAGEWRLTLDAEQITAARLAILGLFWNHAEDEGWPADGRIRWRPPSGVPFDIPPAPTNAMVRLIPGDAARTASERGDWLYLPNGTPPDGQPERVFVPPSGAGHDRLAELVRHGSEVAWSELGLPPSRTGRYASMIPVTERWSLHIALTTQQANDLAHVLEQKPAAQFKGGISLGEAEQQVGRAGSVWRAGQAQPEMLISEQRLDAGVVAASSLRGMPITRPPSLPTPAAVALSVHWIWRITPPRPPKAAAEDPLVKAWRTLDRQYAGRVAAALDTLKTVESEESALARFAGLAGNLLGFRQSRSRLGDALRGHSDGVPSSLGPHGARERLTELADLEQKVRQLVEAVAEADRKAREGEERQRQEQEHQQAQQKAREDLVALRHEQDEKQAEQDKIDAQLGELAATTGISKKDRRARRNKLTDEQKRVERRISQIDSAIVQAEATLATPFEYRQTAPPGGGKLGAGSFVPPAPSVAQKVPEEELPVVGRLLRAGNDRFLAISRWNDLDRGVAEASRLHAQLVADVEGK